MTPERTSTAETSSRLARLLSRPRAPGHGFAWVTVECLLLVGAVAVADYLSGFEVAFSIFYIVPVALATWRGSRALGLVVSSLSAVVWVIVDVIGGHVFSHPLIPVWNGAVRLAFYLLTTALIGEVRRLVEREAQLARTDSLTGLLNSRAFSEEGGRLIELAWRRGHSFTLGYLDLDNFKCVNDRHGHSAGDDLLFAVAGALAGNVRPYDLVARLGGDEFALLLPETDAADARAILAKLGAALAPAFATTDCAVGFSAGFVTFVDAPSSLDEAVRVADGLMYEVKRQGKGRVEHMMWSAAAGLAPQETKVST